MVPKEIQRTKVDLIHHVIIYEIQKSKAAEPFSQVIDMSSFPPAAILKRRIKFVG